MDNNTIIESLHWRYATKYFDPEKTLSEETLTILFESVRLAPSSFGLQPWKLVLVENNETRTQLQNVSYNQSQITDASHLLVLARHQQLGTREVDMYLNLLAKEQGKDITSFNGFRDIIKGFIQRQTDDEHQHWLDHQCYIALGFLMETAALLKVDACPMEGFVKSEYNRILNLSEQGLSCTVVCPIGYRLETDKYANQKKIRFTLDDILIKK